jgi:hypothetical protein
VANLDGRPHLANLVLLHLAAACTCFVRRRYVVNNDGSGYEVNCEEMRVSPIGLDINKSGTVERMSGFFFFDIDGVGEKKFLKEWFAPTEGILVDTRIAGEMSGLQLFGDQGGKYKDGYAKLALLDANKDGQLTGDELAGLAVWVDANSDAKVQPGEITSLESHGVVELSTTHTKFISTAELATGDTIETEDLWFLEPEDRRRR